MDPLSQSHVNAPERPNPPEPVEVTPPTPQNQPQVQPSNTTLGIVGLTLAILLPPVGLALSIIALVKTKNNPSQGKTIPVIGIVVGSVLSIALVVAAVFMFFATLFLNAVTGSGSENIAQTEATAIVAPLNNNQTRLVCDDGYSGKGLDSVDPWYTAYYELPSQDAVSRLIDAAKAQGYALQEDTAAAARLAKSYDSRNEYLIAPTKNDYTLQVTIYRTDKVTIRCRSMQQNTVTPAAANDIAEITLSAPSVR